MYKQEEAWDLADNVVILHQGKIQQIGSPTEIAAAPANPFVMNFVSDVAHIPATSQVGFCFCWRLQRKMLSTKTTSALRNLGRSIDNSLGGNDVVA